MARRISADGPEPSVISRSRSRAYARSHFARAFTRKWIVPDFHLRSSSSSAKSTAASSCSDCDKPKLAVLRPATRRSRPTPRRAGTAVRWPRSYRSASHRGCRWPTGRSPQPSGERDAGTGHARCRTSASSGRALIASAERGLGYAQCFRSLNPDLGPAVARPKRTGRAATVLRPSSSTQRGGELIGFFPPALHLRGFHLRLRVEGQTGSDVGPAPMRQIVLLRRRPTAAPRCCRWM